MIMSKRIYKKLLLSAGALVLLGVGALAQAYGSYTPYSIYGVGDLYGEGTAYNRSMAGVGIAVRNNHFINPVNPAAVTARDSLAFMADYSLYHDSKIFSQDGMKSVSNVTNLGDLIISFPIYRSSAMMLGVMPLSNTGYGYVSTYNDPSLVADMGKVVYTASGIGGLYQIFAGAGVTFFDKLSIGAQAIYVFGNSQKKYYESISESSYLGATNGYNSILNGFTGKVGVQFEQKIAEGKLTVGATYRFATKLKGTVEGYRYSTGTAATDTLYQNVNDLSQLTKPVTLGDEIGIGISYNYRDKFTASFDYTRTDWSNSNFDKTAGFAGNTIAGSGNSIFSSAVSQAFRAGVEYVPNKGDIRYYFNRCSYKAGVYYKSDYFQLDGNNVNSKGVTLGITLPVFRWYNGLTLGVDLGQRANATMIKENYFKFSVGLNIFDIWFQQPKYD